METQNIYNIFERAANKFPTNTAIISGDESISYHKLQYAVQHKANELIASGINKGDKILVFVPMSIELYTLLLATFKIGAIAVFVDEWANKERLTNCLTKVPCKGFAGGLKAQVLRAFYKPLQSIPVKLSAKINTAKIVIEPALEVTKNDTALITFTTGSTSIPKAANRTHAFLMAQYKVLIEELQTQPTAVDFIGLPIVVLCNLGSGATSVLPNYNLKKLDKIKPTKLGDFLNKHKVNRIINSPAFFTKIGSENTVVLNEVTRIFTGGAPVFPKDVAVFEKAFPKAQINILYGSTEAEPISLIQATELVKKESELTTFGLCVGEISDAVQLKLIKKTSKEIIEASDFTDLKVNEGGIGEILVSGNHVLKEYLNSETDTRKNKIKEGDVVWHRTGDAGLIKDGKLYLQGRIDNLFQFENNTISPFIYEYLFSEEKNINKGTVLLINNQVTAFVEPNNWKKKELMEKQLKVKYPFINKVVPVKKMPLDARHNSKIDYAKLKLLS